MWEGGALNVPAGKPFFTIQDSQIKIARLGGRWSDHRSKEFLFPAKPSISDISQQHVGDCFFLASVQAILHTEPSGLTIYDMIREDAFSWITVRFYNLKDHSEFYVKFQKTVPWFPGFGTLYAKGPLWVAMLEKAWAVANYKNSYEASLKGGSSMDALGMIRGPGRSTEIRGFFGSGIENLRILFGLGTNTTHYQRVRSGDDRARAKSLAVLNKWRDAVFNTSQVFMDRWLAFNNGARLLPLFEDFLKKHEGLIVQRAANMADNDTTLRRQIARIEQFEKWMDEHTNGLEVAIQACIVKYARNIFPGKRGTGKYSEVDIKAFACLQNGLAKKDLLTAGTYRQTGTHKSARKGTVGEEVSKGLVGCHMYTVMAVAEDHQPPFRRWIKLRNPWGRTVRAYILEDRGPKLNAVELNPDPKQKNVVARQTFIKPEMETQSVITLAQQGIFWVELSDFVKRFNSVQSGL